MDSSLTAAEAIGRWIRARLREGRLGRCAAREEIRQEPDRVRDAELAVVIDVSGVEAPRPVVAKEQIPEDPDRIRDVEGRVQVDVAPAEPELSQLGTAEEHVHASPAPAQ